MGKKWKALFSDSLFVFNILGLPAVHQGSMLFRVWRSLLTFVCSCALEEKTHNFWLGWWWARKKGLLFMFWRNLLWPGTCYFPFDSFFFLFSIRRLWRRKRPWMWRAVYLELVLPSWTELWFAFSSLHLILWISIVKLASCRGFCWSAELLVVFVEDPNCLSYWSFNPSL